MRSPRVASRRRSAIRARLGLLAGALVLAPVLVVADNWHNDRIVNLRDSPAELAAGAVAAAVVLAALVWLIRARPRWLPVAFVAVLPFRIPLDLGGSTANLLVPLYGLLAAGLIAALLEPERILPDADRTAPGDLRRWLAPVLAVILVLYGLQTAYTDDLSTAVKDVGFFYVPFAALYVMLAGARWDRELLRALVWVIAITALLVAIVAFGQYATGKLFWNDKVIAGNEAHAYFRVNSVFYDPNIMGRFLDVALVLLAGVTAWARRREATLAAGAFVVVLLALVITFSQSSMLALIAGMLVIAACRWGLGRGVAAAAAIVVLMAIATFAIEGGGLTAETTGRTGLISGGLHMFEDRPIEGYGAGSFGDRVRCPLRRHRHRLLGREPHRARHRAGRAGSDRDRAVPDAARRRGRRLVERRRAWLEAGPRSGRGDAARRLRGHGRAQHGLRGLPHRPAHLGDPRARSRPT